MLLLLPWGGFAKGFSRPPGSGVYVRGMYICMYGVRTNVRTNGSTHACKACYACACTCACAPRIDRGTDETSRRRVRPAGLGSKMETMRK